MRDYDNMPKIDWQNDKATLARIKAQISLQEPVIIYLPEDFKLSFDAAACGCECKAKMQFNCRPQALFSALAKDNDLPSLIELGDLAHVKGQVVDVDLNKQILIIYD
jgi:hypothetical protein